MHSRRQFLAAAGALALPAFAGTAKPIRYGYTAMTWGKEERQAVDDISSAGYEGIQFRIDATTEFKPDELRALLAQRH
jgi:inosose dehydratase